MTTIVRRRNLDRVTPMLVMTTSAVSSSVADNDYIDQIDKQAHLDAAQALLGVSPGTTAIFTLGGGREYSSANVVGLGFTSDVTSMDIQPIAAEEADSNVTSDMDTCDMAHKTMVGSAREIVSHSNKKLSEWEVALVRMRHENVKSHRFSIPTSYETLSPTDATPTQQTVKTNCPLDALAMLASNADILDVSSDDYDNENGLPVRRRRSISNPEGMEKWDSLRRAAFTAARHFVQPTIMEDEEGWQPQRDVRDKTQSEKIAVKKRSKSLGSDVEMAEEQDETNEPDDQNVPIDEIKNLSESDLQEMLRRARAKLLEDAITSDQSNSADGLVLPHALDKYREVSGL